MKQYICPSPCKEATECPHRVKHERVIRPGHGKVKPRDCCQEIKNTIYKDFVLCPECKEVVC